MNLEPVRLKTLPERDNDQIQGILERLVRLQKEGRIKEIAVVYLDDEGISRAVLSDSTRMSSLAFFIEYLRQYLSRWMYKL